ncbi:XRE family transcriptional regulator [Actinocorallia longicatena]
MTQDGELDAVVRKRIRGLRLAQGLSLDELAGLCFLSPSTLSRIETGHRRISLDQLSGIARALSTPLDRLLEPVADEDVVIRPRQDAARGMTSWLLSSEPGLTVAKIRITRPADELGPDEQKVHPGTDWFLVLSGTVVLLLGERTIVVEAGHAARFSTMVPHAFGSRGGPAEVIGIFDPDGQRTHLRDER